MNRDTHDQFTSHHDTLGSLPLEIIQLIASFLEVLDLYGFNFTCKKLCNALKSEKLWKKCIIRTHPFFDGTQYAYWRKLGQIMPSKHILMENLLNTWETLLNDHHFKWIKVRNSSISRSSQKVLDS